MVFDSYLERYLSSNEGMIIIEDRIMIRMKNSNKQVVFSFIMFVL